MKTLKYVLSSILLLILTFVYAVPANASNDTTVAILISGIADGPLSSSPKTIEFTALKNIPDLSVYGFSVVLNGNGSSGAPANFVLDPVPLNQGQRFYVANDSAAFNQFFGFNAHQILGGINFNGDDAVELYCNDTIIDVFGEVDVDGTGQIWEYTDGWAYRVNYTGPDCDTFRPYHWNYAFDVFDGTNTNEEAGVDSFPLASYEPPVQGSPCDITGFITLDECDPVSGSNLATPVAVVTGGSGTYVYNILGTPLVGGPLPSGIPDAAFPFDASGLTISVVFVDPAMPQCADTVSFADYCAIDTNCLNLVISGVIDGPLSGGTPKAVEVTALDSIPDLSIFGLGVANNGGGSDGVEYEFPPVSLAKGEHFIVASEASNFSAFFGFPPDDVDGDIEANGDDAIQLFCYDSVGVDTSTGMPIIEALVIDSYGDTNEDGSGMVWDFLDGWAYRICGTGPDGAYFVDSNWIYSGINALDDETSNATAANPFPIFSYDMNCIFPDSNCMISINDSIGLCNPVTDSFAISINPTVENGGPQNAYYYTINGSGGFGPFPYGTTVSGNFPADGSSVWIIGVYDADSTSCVDSSIVAAPASCTTPDSCDNLILTGVIDATLPGGNPKAIELYVAEDISDLSSYGIGVANNGGGTEGEEYSFPDDFITSGSFIYVTKDSAAFNEWFGFNADYISGSIDFNGDDAVELFCAANVVDVFGDPDTDGTGEVWEFMDGWAYRNCGTGPDTDVFQADSWTFSGINVLDDENDNASASVPFPTMTYMLDCPTGPCPDTLYITGPINPDGTSEASSFIETSGAVIVLNGSNTVFSAPDGVLLNALFEVESGAEFEVRFEGCEPMGLPFAPMRIHSSVPGLLQPSVGAR